MKAICVNKPNDIQCVEVPETAEPKENEVRVQVKAVGICGGDLHIMAGSNPFVLYPRIIGHEVAGIIDAIGGKVTNVKVGDHVVVYNVLSCGTCYACTHDRNNVCLNLKAMGVHFEGGMQEYFNIASGNVFKIRRDIEFPVAAMVEPYSIAGQSTWRGRLASDDIVMINGAGPIGLMVLEVVKNSGAKVAITDLQDIRLHVGKEIGADLILNPKRDDITREILKFSNGEGCSLVFEATGSTKVFEECIATYTGSAGRIVVLGYPNEYAKVKPSDIMKKEIDILGSRLSNHQFERAINWIESGTVSPKRFISRVYPLDEALEAIRVSREEPEKVLKVVIEF
jgi:L-gulonate 5-dehydrogenase